MNEVEQIKQFIIETRDSYAAAKNPSKQEFIDGLNSIIAFVDSFLSGSIQRNLDLMKKSWYQQGYLDAKFNREPQWALENLHYKENPNYGKALPTSSDYGCIWGREPSEVSCRYCGVACGLRKPEHIAATTTVVGSKQEAVGLSIMAYLDSRIKNDNNLVCGVPLKVAREWIRECIAQRESCKENGDSFTREELEEEVAVFVKQLEDNDQVANIRRVAKHFASWQYQKDRGKFAELKAREWHDGFNACREQMEKEAVPFYDILKAVPPTEDRDNVKLIILKDDERSATEG